MKRKKIIIWGKQAAITCILLISLLSTVSFQPVKSSDTQKDGQWTIVEYFELPDSSSGLAFDGEFLYSGIYGSNGDYIYQINRTTGTYSFYCSGPQNDAYGLSYDGTYFWTTDHPSNPAQAQQFDSSGSLIDQFSLPDQYMSGIAYDDGDFWVSTYYPDPGTIYKVDDSGSILDSFTAPDDQPWDLAVQDENLWMADYWGDTIYLIDSTSGSVLDSYPSASSDPSGIVWDGSYLWYCDNGFDGVEYLYKVDLDGSGTPEINPQSTSHNFGMVTVGTTETWNLYVQNSGTGDLVLSDIQFSGTGSTYLNCEQSFPITITPGNGVSLTINYSPLQAGALDAIGELTSNDPLNENVELSLAGNAVASGPSIYLPEEYHCYGAVRVNSYNRWQMEVQNMGDSVLTITDVNISNEVFNLDQDFSTPISISPLQSKMIDVWFWPDDLDFFTGIVTIESNDPVNSVVNVSVTGSGSEVPLSMGSLIWDYMIDDPYDSSPKAIHYIPDINGDMKPEVIVCSEDNYIRCFNGNDHGDGDVLWSVEIYSGSLYHQNEITLTEDLDGDGIQDIIIGTPWGDDSIIALSSKDGDQIWKHDTHEYGDGGWVYQVSMAPDQTGDGISEVLASAGDDGDDTGPNRVYMLNGMTGDSIWECYLAGPGFSVISVKDFTGDGVDDVVAGASTMDETTGKVFGLNGATGGIQWVITTTGSSVWALAQLDDINGDGIPDVIAGDFSGRYYGLDATDGNQLFSAYVGSGIILRFEVLGDVNDDGYKDVAVGHSGTVARVINGYNGNAVWTKGLVDKSWHVASCGDISGDGVPDVIIGTLYSNNKCYFMNGTDGDTMAVIDIESAVDGLATIPDLTDDGSMEVIVGTRNGGVLCLSGGLQASSPIENTVITEVLPGWNFMSAPFIQDIDKTDIIVEYNDENYSWADAVSNGYVNEYIFGWDETGQSYQFVDALQSGKGCWLYATEQLTLYALDCNENPDDDITSMAQGWNVIGLPFSENIEKTALSYTVGATSYDWDDAVSNSYVSDFIFGWNRSQQSYNFASTLIPGEAYWCYAYVAGELSR
jgi:hypothetical protein